MRIFSVVCLSCFGLWSSVQTASGQLITEYPLPIADEAPWVLATGPDDAVWYTVNGKAKVGRITITGDITEFDFPEVFSANSLSVGPDGNLWAGATSRIFRITTEGIITSFPSPFNSSLPDTASSQVLRDTVGGTDGNIWAGTSSQDSTSHAVSKITPDGVFTVYPLPDDFGPPGAMTIGPDDNVWFISFNSGKIGTVTTDGAITIFDLGVSPASAGIVTGPDGNLWFSDWANEKMGRMTPQGAVTLFDFPTDGFRPQKIVVGGDGNLWTSGGQLSNKIASITTDGVITEYDLPDDARTFGITVGADNNLWIAESFERKMIAVFAIPGPVVEPDPGIKVGAVFSSAQAESQSFVRFYNNGATDSSAIVTLKDGNTGESLGQWTSPQIGAGEAPQYSIETIENAMVINPKPDFYTLSIDENFNGLFQHILWRSSDGTLTNLSTCSSGSLAPRRELSGVHTRTLETGYPSTIVVHNTELDSATVTLGVYDARDGALLATFESASIPSNGQLIIPVSEIEAQTGLIPTQSMFHFVVKIENNFSGFLQHLVENQAAGVITDMSAVCEIGTVPPRTTANIVEFALPDAETDPGKLIVGPDGDLLVDMIQSDLVASVSLNGDVDMSAINLGVESDIEGPNTINDMTLGPEGNLWYSTSTLMGRVSFTGADGNFGLPDLFPSTPPRMAAGADGNMWFVRFWADGIGRVTQAGEFTLFPLPGYEDVGLNFNLKARLISIAPGPADNTHFAMRGPHQIGRISNVGAVDYFDIPDPYDNPLGLTAGPESTVWFSTADQPAIGRMDVDGTMAMFPLSGPNSAPRAITEGPNGNMWFTDPGTNEIGRVTMDGAISLYDLPTAASTPASIVQASDGNIWFTQQSARQIGRLSPTITGIASPAIFSSSQQSSQSFLRFVNEDENPQSVNITLSDYETGSTLGEWSSPAIPSNSAQQFSIASIENEAGILAPRPEYYSLSISGRFNGYYQHVLWRSDDGTLTNLTSCSETLTSNASQIANVHTSILDDGYPSSVVILNSEPVDRAPVLELYDARDGVLLGTLTTQNIPPGGQLILDVKDIESAADITPSSSMYHYVIKAQVPFAGHLQHLVNNQQAGVVTDMTAVCALQ